MVVSLILSVDLYGWQPYFMKVYIYILIIMWNIAASSKILREWSQEKVVFS